MVNKIRNGVVFIRTPKCATSTIAKHLQSFCDWKGMNYTPAGEHGNMAPPKYFNLGHLYAGNVNWDIVKREQRGVIGAVRDPLSRFISHYKHNVSINTFSPQIKEMGISKFYIENHHNTHFENEFRGMDNYMVKYLGVGDDTHWSSDMLKSKYDFMFVAEQIQLGLEKFQKLTGYGFQNTDMYENKSEKLRLYKTQEFIDLFKERNKQDYELYNFVLERYGYEK